MLLRRLLSEVPDKARSMERGEGSGTPCRHETYSSVTHLHESARRAFNIGRHGTFCCSPVNTFSCGIARAALNLPACLSGAYLSAWPCVPASSAVSTYIFLVQGRPVVSYCADTHTHVGSIRHPVGCEGINGDIETAADPKLKLQLLGSAASPLASPYVWEVVVVSASSIADVLACALSGEQQR